MVATTKLKVIENQSPNEHKRKRWNKNKKKAHRKRIDISDVEKILEDKRREERLGGPLSEKESADLLFLDAGGDAEAQTLDQGLPLGTDVSAPPTTELVGFKAMRKKMPKTTLKCHSLLRGLPGAKPPSKSRKRLVSTKPKEIDPILAKKMETPQYKAKVERKQNQQDKDISRTKKQKLLKPTSNRTKDYGFDLWDKKNADSDDEMTESYIRDLKLYYRRVTKVAPVKAPKNHSKAPSAIPAILPPDAGASYNPSYEAHQELLLKAVRMEEKRLEKIEKIERQTTAHYPTRENAPTVATWLQEMSEGLNVKDAHEEEVQVDTSDKVTVSGLALNERKTKKQRRKEMEQKKAALKKNAAKLAKVREAEVYKIKSLNKELDVLEKLREIGRDNRAARLAKKPFQTKKLSTMKFQEDDVAVTLGDELTDCLRKLKPHGSLMEEHFRSLQRRNLIETRLRAKSNRKYKIRRQIKRSHRCPYEDLRKTSV